VPTPLWLPAAPRRAGATVVRGSSCGVAGADQADDPLAGAANKLPPARSRSGRG